MLRVDARRASRRGRRVGVARRARARRARTRARTTRATTRVRGALADDVARVGTRAFVGISPRERSLGARARR